MDNNKLMLPNKIKLSDICVAQMLYGGDGVPIKGCAVYKGKPYTLAVGYVLENKVFVNKYGRYVPLYEEGKELPLGIYAYINDTKYFDFSNLGEEKDSKDLKVLLDLAEDMLYKTLDKLGAREFTELVPITLHFLEDNDIGLNTEVPKLR